MKWQNKNIKDLSDDELKDAIHLVAEIDKNRVDKLAQSRKRHIKLFNDKPPVENNTFIELTIELNQEFKNRKLKEI